VRTYGLPVINGILFGGVVVLWAAFLVPWALRRYDEAMSERPIDTFSDAVRVLRRSGKGDEKLVASRRALKAGEPSGAYARVRPPSRAAARAAAARRRRVLLTLLAVLAVVGGLATFSVVPVWAVAIPVALVVTWLVLCRVQVRGEDAAAWAHRRAADSAERRDPADDEVTVRIATGTVASAPVVGPNQVDTAAAPVSEADLAEHTSDVVAVETNDGSSLWDPLPVTLPTYVSKPRASRSIRTIDLDAPNTWTSGHVEGEQTELPAAKVATEHRRAVGG
jgi:hypothetical protein